jgi:bifunctional non-homologous end joining protein LigD
MGLEEYSAKRDFTVTPEPAGALGATSSGELSFVVHKHAARALHYDLRLEVGGVLASWAVPKGPSLDPADKRLAVHVEDHPLEYGGFEGVIPAGEYGGGTVMIWDRGAFAPLGDAAAGVAKGHLKFVLAGTKLKGAWALVRMKPRAGESRENWLLIKERDEHVRPHAEYDLLADRPQSAASGRSMEEIAAAGQLYEGPRVGDAAGPDPAAGTAAGVPAGSRTVEAVATASGAVAGPMPLDAPFQLATLVAEAPEGGEWIHEVKYDGYRVRVALERGRARVLTRHAADWTERFAGIADAAAGLPAASALIDGEAVAFDGEGRSDFGLLQEALATGRRAGVVLVAFDLLYLDGFDLRDEALLRRKGLLAALLETAAPQGPLRYVEHYSGAGPAFHSSSCDLLLEGSVSKRGDRPWVPGRSRDWLKAKCLARQEFVVGGWTDPAGSRSRFGALLLGVRDAEGALRYAGRVGTGFDERTLASVGSRLDALATDDAPFADPPPARVVHWTRPELVVEVAFREWTRDGIVRQPSFKGIRDDADAGSVVREDPAAAPAGSRGPAGPVVISGIAISNPDKVLDPAGISKRDLALYYEAVAPAMLPHLTGRPITAVRCPHGRGGPGDCFYQKHPEPRGWPEALLSVKLVDADGPADYFFAQDAAGLLSLVQLGCLEIHTWNSLAADPERPDRIVFDLDPGEGLGFADVVGAARVVRDALGALGLRSFAKTTGGRGLHVIAPVAVEHGYDAVRGFAHALCARLAESDPGRFTDKMAKERRPGRVFIDYLRNAHGATAVCAYSTRARPDVPVSVPVTWDELDGLDPVALDTTSVPPRLASLASDPWSGYEAARARLTPEVFAAVGVGPTR